MKIWLDNIRLLQKQEVDMFGMKYWSTGSGVTLKMVLKIWRMAMIISMLLAVMKKLKVLHRITWGQRSLWL